MERKASVKITAGNAKPITITVKQAAYTPPSIYIAGYEKNDDVYISGRVGNNACYWKNGVRVNLSKKGNSASAQSIYVDNNKVYIAGYQVIESLRRACFWEKGTVVTLGYADSESQVLSVFVVNDQMYTARSMTVPEKTIDQQPAIGKIEQLILLEKTRNIEKKHQLLLFSLMVKMYQDMNINIREQLFVIRKME